MADVLLARSRTRDSASSYLRQRRARTTARVEGLAWIIAISIVQPWTRLDHFTWWGVLWHTGSLFVDPGARHDIAVQFTIVVGVWAMSAAACTMLTVTHDDSGTLAYMAGNFAVHYAPLISALAHSPSKNKRSGPMPLLFWLAYVTVVGNPSDVYGCPLPRAVPIVCLAIVTTLACIA